MQTIIEKIRNLIGDNAQYTTDIFVYYTSQIFTLSESNVVASSLSALKNGVAYASSNYTFNSNTGKVTVTATLVAGDILEFDYNACKKYSDNEIKGYVRASFTYLMTEKYHCFIARSDDEIFPSPTEAEENLIALIASILITGGLSEYRTPEVTISFNVKETMEEKITRVIRQFRKTFGTIKYIELDSEISIDDEDD